MKNSKRIMSVLMLWALAVIGVGAQTQQRSARVNNRQVTNILQRLEQSSNTFRASLNVALINARIDQTRPQNDINSFEAAFTSAKDELMERFTRSGAGAAEVGN